MKCQSKGLECPGYGRRLRWKSPSISPAETVTAPTVLGIRAEQPVHDRNERTPSSPLDISETDRFSLALPKNRRLIDHYTNNIAPIMVWLHSEHNPYKRLVAPLSESQKSLRFAILSIAAAHAASTLGVDAEFSRSAYDNALMLITERVREMANGELVTQHARATSGGDAHQGVLAAALILSNHSLFGTELSLSRIHRKAVRIIIDTIKSNIIGSESELFIFLNNQAAIYDILVCTTIFDRDNIEGAILPVYKKGNVMFGHFLNVVHDITKCSVSKNRDVPHTTLSKITDFEDQLELAHSYTFLAAAPILESCGYDAKEDFMRIARLYHHAGVLYACKRLCVDPNSWIESYHASKLFRLFTQFHDLNTALHNLAWPVFIAGICSWPNVERMQAVGKLSRTLYGDTGYGHYKGISEFHEELWDSDHDDWIKLAQEWEEKGRQVIPV